MSNRARTWLTAFSEVLRAVRADPLLFAPTLVIVLLAALATYLAWRFI